MIIFTKIVSILLALLVISKTYLDYKKKREGLTMFLFWSITWVAIVYVAIKPSIFYKFATSLSNKDVGMGTFVGLAFVFLFYITYRVYVKANRLEQKLKDIVMKIGIKDIDEE